MAEDPHWVARDVALVAFEWDEAKRQKNIERHGLDFIDAARALLRSHLARASDRGGEKRSVAIARVDMRVIAVIYTMRGDVCRIISARAARRNERKAYHRTFG